MVAHQSCRPNAGAASVTAPREILAADDSLLIYCVTFKSSAFAAETGVPLAPSAEIVMAYVPAGVPPELCELELVEHPAKSVAVMAIRQALEAHLKFRLRSPKMKKKAAPKTAKSNLSAIVNFVAGGTL